MYSYLSGKLSKIKDSIVILDVQGVGFEVHVPIRSLILLPEIGSTLILYTYFHVREDTQALYGFLNEEEKGLFKLLLSVTGIGPKLALGILNGIGPKDFKTSIENEDEKYLASIPGIGRKTASRLILELKDKILAFQFEEGSPEAQASREMNEMMKDALLALTSLGYTRPKAKEAVQEAYQDSDKAVSLEQLIRNSINILNR